MEELPNGWTWEAARDRACKIGEARPGDSWFATLARYIAQHEKPPVDPDLMLLADVLEAIGLVTRAKWIRDGDVGGGAAAALKLLKERK